jgi:aspartyl-tRNA(Asn)/glutamyl-tRNA(Gln) amidotransferase subunit C
VEINRELVERMASLAGLEFEAGEKETFIRQFKEIIRWIEQLQALDTSHVHPAPGLPQRPDFRTPMRDDTPRESLPQDAVFESAPARREDFFQVPPVIPSKK